MDLTREMPRSPYEKLGGLVFLPRTIDKGRADLAGTLGDYISRTGRSQRLYAFLGVTADEFVEALRDRPTDDEMWEWLATRMPPRNPEEIADFNRQMWQSTPEDACDTWTWDQFWEFFNEMGQGHRRDITRHFDRLDLDEGREVPTGGRQDF